VTIVSSTAGTAFRDPLADHEIVLAERLLRE
jgi:hypothetical protein